MLKYIFFELELVRKAEGSANLKKKKRKRS